MKEKNQKFSMLDFIRGSDGKAAARAFDVIKENPEIAAMISKLTHPREKSIFDIQSSEKSLAALNFSQLRSIVDINKTRRIDNENILQLFPDIELAISIIISSMLSPKDMVSTEILYNLDNSVIPSELSFKVLEIIQTNLEKHYKIKDKQSLKIREAMFTCGAHIEMILPESIVDQVINGDKQISLENMQDIFNQDSKVNSFGFTAPRTKTEDKHLNVILESFDITDNPYFLKLPKLMEKIQKTNSAMLMKRPGMALEGISELTVNEFNTLVYKSSNNEFKPFTNIPSRLNAKRKSVGRPMTMKIPAESAIPIYPAGDCTNYAGFLIAIDINGNPITVDSLTENTAAAGQGLQAMMGNATGDNNGMSSALIAKAKTQLTASDKMPTITNMWEIYNNIFETELATRINGGRIGKNMVIGQSEEISRIMFTRALANKFTRFVYVPAEYINYNCYDTFRNGVGKSALDDLKILCSIRAILLFTKVYAMIKSSINITRVNIKFDPEDPDPNKAIEMAMQSIGDTRRQFLPLWTSTPSDIMDWLKYAGLEMSFQDHPGLPDTQFEFETKNIDYNVPNDELDEVLRKQTYMRFGLSPETVDNGMNSEYATTAVFNNILFSKRILGFQNIHAKNETDYARKICTHDMVIRKEIKDLFNENIGAIENVLSDDEKQYLAASKEDFIESLIDLTIECLEISLPKPDTTSIENQSVAFEAYMESLDKTLPSWISDEFITQDVAGDISGSVSTLVPIYKHYFARKWMAENGFMPELSEITTSNDDGKAAIDLKEINTSHMTGLMKSCIDFIKAMKPIRDAADKDLQNLQVEGGGNDSSTDSTSDSTESGDSFGDDFGSDAGTGTDESGSDTTEAGSDTNTDETTDDTTDNATDDTATE